MTKVKLSNGTIINASDVVLVNGALQITTTDLTVEELAELFSNKENTSLITLMTESEKECGYKTGFTSFSGINYDSEGNKTVELFQPIDATEARISNVEGSVNSVDGKVSELEIAVDALLGTEEEETETTEAGGEVNE